MATEQTEKADLDLKAQPPVNIAAMNAKQLHDYMTKIDKDHKQKMVHLRRLLCCLEGGKALLDKKASE